MGGEEFLIILPGAGEEPMRMLGERMRYAVAAQPCAALDGDAQRWAVPVTVSVGGATTQTTFAGSADELVAFADQAMYAAKRGGRDQVAVTSR